MPRWSAVRRARPAQGRAHAPTAWILFGALRRSIPSGLARGETCPRQGGEDRRRTPRLAKTGAAERWLNAIHAPRTVAADAPLGLSAANEINPEGDP